MALEFNQWIVKKNSQIGDKSGKRVVDIDVGAGKKVQVYQSADSVLKQVVTVDNVAVRPIDSKVEPDLDGWRKNEQLRRDVVQKLVAHLTETSKKITASKDAKALTKAKAALRVSALKSLLVGESSEQFLPGAAYSLVLTSTYPSLLGLANQLIPYLLSGIPLSVLSNAQSSIHVAYLIDLLLEFGLPSGGIVNQLIDFDVTNAGQVATFIALENADIDSVIDNALTSQFVYGIPCVKLFVEELHRDKVKRVFQHKLEIQYPESELFCENELFPQEASKEVKVHLDPVHFEHTQSGIEVHYFRSIGEVLKMVNFLSGPYRQKFVSIWSESSGLALKIAQAVQSCKQVAINGIPISGSGNSSGWQFELIASTPLSRLVADNAESLKSLVANPINKSWSSSSLATRVRTVHSLLDNLQLTNAATIKLALQKTTKEIDDSPAAANKMFITDYEPIGHIIVQLSDGQQIDDTALLSFGLNAIIYGNALIIGGGKSASKQFATWKRIEDFLGTKGFNGVIQTVQGGGAGFKVDTTSQGALQLLADDAGRTLRGVLLDQSQFQQDFYGRVLRRVRRSLVHSLAEYDMSKLVE